MHSAHRKHHSHAKRYRRPSQSMFVNLMHDMLATYRLSKKNDLSLYSAAIAFLSLFAFCPLFILSFLTCQYLLGKTEHTESIEHLNRIIGTIIPVGTTIISKNILLVLKKNALNSAISLGLLVWSSLELFFGLQKVFLRLSYRKTDTHEWIGHATAGVCFIVVFSAGSLYLLMSLPDRMVLQTLFNAYWPGFPTGQVDRASGLASFVLVLSGIAVVYKLMPNEPIKTLTALRGSILFLALFFFGKISYDIYLVLYRALNRGVYGSFLGVLEVIVWFYFISHIFLFCAQYTVYLQNRLDWFEFEERD